MAQMIDRERVFDHRPVGQTSVDQRSPKRTTQA
jgi:hypothetical protein